MKPVWNVRLDLAAVGKCAVGCAIVLLFMASIAGAQVMPRDYEPDMTLPEDYKPIGVPAGSFDIFANVDLGYRSDSNIFASETGAVSDNISVVLPGLDILSNWNNHELNFRSKGELATYADKQNESYNDVDVSVDGRIDIQQDVNIFYQAAYLDLHENRGSPDNVNGIKPTRYKITSGTIGFSHEVSAMTVRIEGNLDSYNFSDAPTSTGIDINNRGRSRDQIETSLRLGYKIDNAYEAFVKGAVINRNYDDAVDRYGFNRDSKGYRAVAGIRLDYTGVTSGEFFIGTRSQNYDDSQLATIEGLDIGGTLLWRPTALTAVNLYLSRTVEESTLSSASGYFLTTLGANINHSMLENVLFTLGVSGSNFDYEGIDRNDDILDAIVGAEYFLNRSFWVGVDYNYIERSSNINGQDYARGLATIKVGARL